MDISGKQRRLSRVLTRYNGRILMCPIDDSLIAGPINGLSNLVPVLNEFASLRPSGIVGFNLPLRRYGELLCHIPYFLNLTASVVGSNHVSKTRTISVDHAAALGADGIAAHFNLTARNEVQMLKDFASISEECDRHGLPLLAIAYVRRETKDKDDNYLDWAKERPEEYSDMIAHAARIAAEMGADIIKVNYFGPRDFLPKVVAAASGVPLILAGGELGDERDILRRTEDSLREGVSGVAYGRNFYMRTNIREFYQGVEKLIRTVPHKKLET